MGLFAIPLMASFAVDSMRYGFKVRGVAAAGVSTDMVQYKPFWDWHNQRFVGYAVGPLPGTIPPESAITVLTAVSRNPIPAACFGVDSNFVPEPFGKQVKIHVVSCHRSP